MRTTGKKIDAIDEYHKLEIQEIFTRTREHRNQRAQITSFRLSGIWWGRRQVESRIWQKLEYGDARTTTHQTAQPAQSGNHQV